MCFSPFNRIFHWGPLVALGIIKCITGMTIHCCGMWWPANSLGGCLHTGLFLTLSGMTFYNFLAALLHGPGFLPLKWQPKNEDSGDFLQYCKVCEGYKAPRSHHCRKCGRCVLKMDHHCPWINGCVGWANHAHFTAFLAFAVLGCCQATVVLSCCLYRALYRGRYYLAMGGSMAGATPVVSMSLSGLVMCLFALGMALSVVIAVGMLLYFQIRGIVNNRTGIEDWILEKANYRRKESENKFIFPYNLGVVRNIHQVVNYTCHPVGDGIIWEVVDSCDQYTITREQLAQKNEKRSRTKTYSIILGSSSSYVPIWQGFGVLFHPPCTDEPRIALQPGDTVSVTRWRPYWLFGEKINIVEGSNSRVRGWFPRRCAVELVDNETAQARRNFNDKKVK